jgi:hypothetical protein
LTTVDNGSLIVSSAFSGGGNVLVKGGATFGAVNSTGASAQVGTLEANVGATLEFQNVTSATTPLMAANSVVLNGACTVKVSDSDSFVAGGSYPLVGYNGTFSGNLANVQLQMPYGWRGTLVNSGNQLSIADLVVVSDTPTQLGFGVSNGLFQFGWEYDHTGWRLQGKTNLLEGEWFDVSGSMTTNSVSIPMSNSSSFFRLVYP